MREIFVSPEGGRVTVGRRPRQSKTLQQALDAAQPGDVVRLLRGIYKPAGATLRNSGKEGKPITVRADGDAMFEGEAVNLHDLLAKPEDSFGDPALVVAGDWAVVEGLAFTHCWPRAIELRGCQHVVVRKCSGTYGKQLIRAVNAKSPKPPKGLAQHITVEGVHWIQDPDKLLWSGHIQWCHVKQDKESGECCEAYLAPDRSCLNGAMFASRDIAGDVIIRNCHVEHAFNAVRIDARERYTSRAPSNVNVQIYGNKFEYIRDNVTEPEWYAVNVWIHSNEFRNTYAAFSFDDIWGGYWYVFGNKVWTDDPLTNARDGHDWGQCFKFHNETMPRWPVYTFHNSIRTPWPYAKEGFTRHWFDFNNAVEFMAGGNPMKDKNGARNRLAPYFKTPRQYLCWDPSYHFHQTLTNHPEFPDRLNKAGFMVSGLHTERVFKAAANGRFELVPGSPGRGAAADMPIAFADGTSGVLWGGGAIGAMQGGEPYEGPSFIPFQEHQQPGEFDPLPEEE